ncbi:hypothetical protein BDC45DRAFT_576540 [Circinella umbellata]|nr:hypothetical protein BDC45DRAFT_576540 [Circinella umbellata]
MSTRPEKYIHQKESTEDRHKRDYSTELFEEWIASQGNEDMMDLDDNATPAFFISSDIRSSDPYPHPQVRMQMGLYGCGWVYHPIR